MSGSESTREFVKTGVALMVELDFAKMREIAKEIHDNPELLADFERDPEAFALARGFKVPEGLHIHVADENNTLIPPEEAGVFGDASRDAWARIETRAGYKTVSLVACC